MSDSETSTVAADVALTIDRSTTRPPNMTSARCASIPGTALRASTDIVAKRLVTSSIVAWVRTW